MITLWVLVTLVAAIVNSTELGHESIYKYQGLVQTTVPKPTLFRSDFMIDANIRIQWFRSFIKISLENVTHSLYTGKDDDNMDTKLVDIPKEAKSILLPYYVENYENKVFIWTDKYDELWSVNMKAAIASLVNLKIDHIDWNKSSPYGFYSDENTLYGKCKILNNVVPHNNTYSIIRKHLTSCENFKWEMHFNMGEPGQCEAKFEKPISISSDRTYSVHNMGTHLSITNIESIGNILFYPFKAKGDVQSVFVKQYLYLQKTNKINEFQIIDKIHLVQHKLSQFLYGLHTLTDGISDITLSRHKFNSEIATSQIQKMLTNILDYNNKTRVTLQQPDSQHGQSVNMLLEYLRLFKLNNLEHCFYTLNNETHYDQGKLDIFLQIIPQVGTHPSNIFILNLIKSKVVNYSNALHLLRTMPYHTRISNIELLSNLSELYELSDDIDQKIRDTAVLAFASIISKALKYYPEKEDQINRYIDRYIHKFKKISEYKTQVLYMSALQNIGGKKISKFLEQIIRNERVDFPVSYQLRILTMRAAKQEHTKHVDLINTIYWPIFSDTTQHLEIRSIALDFLTSHPTMDSLTKLSWFMQTEKNEDLYNLYYTTLKSLSSTLSPCFRSSAKRAREILHYTRIPINSTQNSEFYQYDYFDSTYGFGAMLKVVQVGNILSHGFTSFYLQMSSQVSNVMVSSYSAYIRVEISKNVINYLSAAVKISNINELIQTFSGIKLSSPHEINIEVIILHHNIVVSVQYYDGRSYMDLMTDFFEQSVDEHLHTKYSCEQMVEGELIIPTDIGFPTVFYITMPEFKKNVQYDGRSKMSTDGNGTISISNKMYWTQWNHQVYGLKTYNPIADLWHGSRRLLTVDAHFPIAIDFSISASQINITFNRDEDQQLSYAGFQSFVQTEVFVYNPNDNDVIIKACPKCNAVSQVTKGKEFLKKYILWEKESEYTGRNYRIVIFDCEHQITSTHIADLQRQFLSNYNKNWGNYPILKYIFAVRHLWAYATASPTAGMCGIGILVSPSKSHLSSHSELILNYENVSIEDSDYNSTWTYSLKHCDQIISSWDLNIIANKLGEYFIDCKIYLTYSKPNEKDYKICIETKQQWSDKSLSRELSILAGITSEKTCPQNKTKIDILTSAEISEEQKSIDFSKKNIYPECDKISKNSVLACSSSQTSLRHYEYDIKYENLSPESINNFMHLHDWMRTIYSDYFERSYGIKRVTQNNEIKITLDYPIRTSDLTVSINTLYSNYQYKGIPLKNWYWTGLVQPISTSSGYTRTCEIGPKNIINQFDNHISIDLPMEWTPYVIDNHINHNWKILAKRTDDNKHTALKIMVGKDILVIIFHWDFQLFFNDKHIPIINKTYGMVSSFKYKILRSKQKVIIRVPHVNLNIEYDGNLIRVTYPINSNITGYCAKGQNGH